MRVSGRIWRMARLASTPFMPGMEMSMMTRSGDRVAARPTASLPSGAMPATRKWLWGASRLRMPSMSNL
jgi:hypothetical protein